MYPLVLYGVFSLLDGFTLVKGCLLDLKLTSFILYTKSGSLYNLLLTLLLQTQYIFISTCLLKVSKLFSQFFVNTQALEPYFNTGIIKVLYKIIFVNVVRRPDENCFVDYKLFFY